jgi:signal transduction histidine kinase
MVLMVREQAARERSEELLRQLTAAHEQLAQAHEQLRASAERVRELATAEERNRIAREIHDSLGHYLTVVNVQLEAALTLRERDAVRAKRASRRSQAAIQRGPVRSATVARGAPPSCA